MAAIPLQDRSMTNTSSDNENERQNEQVNDNEREYINRHVESELDFDGDDEGGVMDRDEDSSVPRTARIRLFAAFILFGLLNNVLYVIILSAALDLVPPTTPKGLVAFFNIFPALLAKVFWPLISVGQIRYGRRIGFCTFCSWLGIITIAFSSALYPRLFGISLASFSSGLGELTFLQFTTTLPTETSSKTALGAWSSGTGAAGIVGAGLWWLLRGLGVKAGLGISSLLPLCFPATHLLLLPPFGQLDTGTAYQALPTHPDEFPHGADSLQHEAIPLPRDEFPRKSGKGSAHLTTQDKFALLRPLIIRYMLPLCAVYIEEYVINSGIAPTLVFPLPTSGLWSALFKTPRDYYPFWSLTYQTFVFLSRSSLSIGLPPIPKRLLPLPSIIQFVVLLLLSLQASRFIFTAPEFVPPNEPTTGVDRSITFVFLFMCLEGLCGGSAYVNTFYHVGREGDDSQDGGGKDVERTKMEREFRIGATGAADSLGILFASLISMPTELALCRAQVEAGRTLCRDL